MNTNKTINLDWADAQSPNLAVERSNTMKSITVVKGEGGGHYDLTILPGTTPQDIKRQLDLPDTFVLTKWGGVESYPDLANLYEELPAGAKLVAATPVEVGGLIATLLGEGDIQKSLLAQARRQMAHPRPLPPALPRLAMPTPPRIAASASLPIAPATRPGAQTTPRPVVQRSEEPIWRQKGWRQHGCLYAGFFRTRQGQWEGRGETRPSGEIHLHINNPPPEVLSGRYGHCLWDAAELGKNWKFIHFYNGLYDLSAGLLRTEQILSQPYV